MTCRQHRNMHHSSGTHEDGGIGIAKPGSCDSLGFAAQPAESKVERLMTLSTSAVAVCCCSDSRSSLSSRVFSMAMTA